MKPSQRWREVEPQIVEDEPVLLCSKIHLSFIVNNQHTLLKRISLRKTVIFSSTPVCCKMWLSPTQDTREQFDGGSFSATIEAKGAQCLELPPKNWGHTWNQNYRVLNLRHRHVSAPWRDLWQAPTLERGFSSFVGWMEPVNVNILVPSPTSRDNRSLWKSAS